MTGSTIPLPDPTSSPVAPPTLAPPVVAPSAPGPTAHDFALERYRYLLQQIAATNENTYRFLAIYQTLATGISGAALLLFANYREWKVPPEIARSGLVSLMGLVSLTACFTVLMVVVGILSWLDYRREECILTDRFVYPGFRESPKLGNFFHWHETYIVLFVLLSVIFIWFIVLTYFLPAIP